MKVCPSCKVRYDEDQAFCSRCGDSLVAEISTKRKSPQTGKKTNMFLLFGLVAIPIAFIIVAVFAYINHEPKASQPTINNAEKGASTSKSQPSASSLNEPALLLPSKPDLPAANKQVPPEEGSGNKLVFVRNGDIWIASSEGTNAQQLTFTGSQASSPALSPDGREVAFMGPGRKAHWKKIFLIPSQGGKIRALNLLNIDYSDSPNFSPDSKQLLLRGRTFRDDNNTVSLLLANFSDFSLQKVLSNGGLADEAADIMASPAFSPDGRLIVYQESDHEPLSGFAIIDLTGKKIARFPFNREADASYLQPRFSADGQEVLCWSYDFKENANRVGNHAIYLVNWRTGIKKILALGTSPTFVDGGKAIVFAKRASHNSPSDLYRLDLVSGARPRLILRNAGAPAGQG
jgi:Tol biopolymer transport system component